MYSPKLKIIIFNILIFLAAVILLFFTTFSIYDQNSYLNFFENIIENKVLVFIDKKIIKLNIDTKTKPIETYNYNIVNIDKRIPSETFLTLLHYLSDSNLKGLFIDVNYDSLLDYYNEEIIKDFINNQNNFYGILYIKNKKGINFQRNKYSVNTELYKNLTNLKKTETPLLFCNYLSKIDIKNNLQINPNKIGFITTKNNIFDKNNYDFIYKFDKKFLISSCFQLYLKDKYWNIHSIDFNYMKIKDTYKYKALYYDQKGKISFKYKHNIDKKPEIQNLEDYLSSLNSREESLKNLLKLKMYNKKDNLFSSYVKEEDIINNIYNYPDLENAESNSILINAKNNATIWKGFKSSNKNNLNNSIVIITHNQNYEKWIDNFIYQNTNIINGKNIRRAPIMIIFLVCLIIFSFLFFILQKLNKKIIFSIIFPVIFIIFNIIFYFSLRISNILDYPFSIILFSTLYGIILGSIASIIDVKIWYKEVKSIYKGSISDNLTKKIVNYWKSNTWNPKSKSYNCSFLHIDTSFYMNMKLTEEDVEFIGQKNSEIEKIIKNNEGVRNNFNSTQILCYFGNPAIQNNHSNMAIKTALEIYNMNVIINNIPNRYRIAIHTKNEWFRFIKKQNQKMYTYYGKSICILAAMIRYAKEFNISIVISDHTYKLSNYKSYVRMLDRIKTPGVTGSIRLFELLPESEYTKNGEFYDYFHAGLKLFEKQKWEEAGAYFRQCLKINEDDKPSQIYLKRCKEFIYIPPDEEWDGTYEIS